MHQTDKDFGKSVITVITVITLPAAPGVNGLKRLKNLIFKISGYNQIDKIKLTK